MYSKITNGFCFLIFQVWEMWTIRTILVLKICMLAPVKISDIDALVRGRDAAIRVS
jgi:hypothetical protein